MNVIIILCDLSGGVTANLGRRGAKNVLINLRKRLMSSKRLVVCAKHPWQIRQTRHWRTLGERGGGRVRISPWKNPVYVPEMPEIS